MDYEMPAWAAHGADEWNHRRDFWTKRKRSATSLLTVMAVLSGIAIGFKLFDQTVPNNVVRDASNFDYTIEKMEAEQNETGFTLASGTNPVFKTSGGQYPGDAREVEVRISNTNAPARDASFKVYVDNITVLNQNGVTVASTDAAAVRFISFFTLTVNKAALGTHVNTGQYTEACSSGFKELNRQAPCDLGLVKAAGSTNTADEPTDQRLYEFIATETDDGTDQSAFKGWDIKFTLVFQAQLPAVPESSAI